MTVAQAQLDEQLDVGETLAVDTDVTPVAKDGSEWSLVAGAKYGQGDVIDGSVTDFDVDLFDVSFVSNKRGFVGGAECLVEPASREGSESCVRGPVIYSYEELKTGEKVWSRADLGAGKDEPGFVGAIAWLDANRAVAVGGSGCYPRREEPCPDGRVSDGPDPIAGAGRAWYFDGSSWRELSEEDGELPAGVGGMSALDFQVGAKGAFGAAGALGQIVEWREDRFDRVLDSDSPESELYNHRFLRHRVREIRFSADGDAHAYAVTAGWSEGDELSSPPVVVQYAGSSWSVSKFGLDATDPADPERTRRDVNNTGWAVSGDPDERRWCAQVSPWQASATCSQYPCWGGFNGIPIVCMPEFREEGSLEQHGVQLEEGTGDEVYDVGGRDLDERQGVPDSFYSLTRVGNCFSALMSDGGPEVDGEPASMLTQRWSSSTSGALNTPADPVVLLSRPRLTTSRLVAGDGDSTTAKTQQETLTTGPVGCGTTNTGDGFPDWSVGELRSEETAGLGRRGLFMSTHLRPPLTGGSNATIDTSVPAPDELGGREVTSEEKLVAHLESGYWRAPSYSLNAIDMLDEFGVGYAVGDHGAILSTTTRTGGGGEVEPDPPRLGSRNAGRLADGSPYDAYRRLTEPPAAGIVPEHWDAEREERPERAYHEVAPLGIGAVRTIVISRDGSEGWAFGQGSRLAHFDGYRWRACNEPSGLLDASEAPPACPPQGLMAPRGAGSVARVPLERDGNPANDDDFELFATNGGEPVRYRAGRWEPEDPDALGGLAVDGQVVFTSPDHAWVLGDRLGSAPGLASPYRFFRFDGERWHDCASAGARTDACDPGGLLPRFHAYADWETEGRGDVLGLVAAGDRVYVFGVRMAGVSGHVLRLIRRTPFILYREKGDAGWRGSGAEGTYDPAGPGAQNILSAPGGLIDGLAVVQRPDGRYEGWAVGAFNGLQVLETRTEDELWPAETPLLRLDPGGSWAPFSDTGPLSDYSLGISHTTVNPDTGGKAGSSRSDQIVIEPAGDDARFSPALIANVGTSTGDRGRMFHFSPGRERFELPAPNPGGHAVALDGRGGAFVSVGDRLFEWTDRPRRAWFGDAPLPARDTQRRIRALAGAADGTLWAATNSEVLYRYDRLTGWDRVRVPGWDRGRLVTVPSAVNAVAVGPDGGGLAVGGGGRIARLSRAGAALDPAAGSVCDLAAPVAPCGTGRDLHAVAVAPDGSALAGGDGLSLLWRPAGGELRAAARPDVSTATRITGIAMPTPDRAWLATSRGLVFAGRLAGGVWSWELENIGPDGDPIRVLAPGGEAVGLRAIAVDGDGRGYALLDGAAELLERSGDGPTPWRKVASPSGRSLGAVALDAGGGEGALLGSGSGILSRLDGRFHVARPEPAAGGAAVSSLVLMPGREDGEVEAWALWGQGQLLHYTSEPADPLLSPLALERPLPDTPAPREGELTLAAFGKTDCHPNGKRRCLEIDGGRALNEVITRRIVEELAERRRSGHGPALSLFTGDAIDGAGYPGNQPAETLLGSKLAHIPHDDGANLGLASVLISGYGPRKLRRFADLVAAPLEDQGVPLLGAIGGRDLSDLTVCKNFDSCDSTSEQVRSGENLAWRQAMASQPDPWGASDRDLDARFQIEPVPDGRLTQRHTDIDLADPDGDGPLQAKKLTTGGASTHYAVDLVEPDGRGALARVVFVDSSLRALAAADGIQQPLEPDSGQLGFLERVLCFRGERAPSGERCTREPHQQAIVVSNTPTYSYGPGVGTQTATDMLALETVLMRHRVNAVVSGRLGWNGMYWASAPGVHEPCPGGDYPEAPPQPGTRACGQGEQTDDPTASVPVANLGQALEGTAVPAPPAAAQLDQQTGALSGALPFIVASGGGGPLAGDDAPAGFWHGYSLIRLAASGDPRETIVEQRPIYDWIAIEAQERTLKPGQKMTLRGFGRVPDGTDSHDHGPLPLRLDHISGAAITHRYDLLTADADQPWLPATDADGEYLPLDPSIATVDRQTGVVKVGKGRQGRTYAVAMLSVGEKTATYPLVFEPAKSFRPRPAIAATIRPPSLQPPAVQAAPPIQVLSQPPTQPPATPPPPAQLPTIGNLQLPTPPQLPGIGATPTTAPTPTPPPPPAPPPPPNSGTGLPLNLNAPISPISIVPTVIPPTPPPINPAPPGGSAARKEAKQRQAAAAKSEEGGGEASGEATELGGDTATGRPGPDHAFTRHDRVKATPSFAALATREQPSAWARGATYGGGLALMALTLAIGWSAGRPTPRRRRPELPAPAWNRADRNGRH